MANINGIFGEYGHKLALTAGYAIAFAIATTTAMAMPMFVQQESLKCVTFGSQTYAGSIT